jgi:hypothetical protein
MAFDHLAVSGCIGAQCDNPGRFLDDACAGDQALREEVEALLAAP